MARMNRGPRTARFSSDIVVIMPIEEIKHEEDRTTTDQPNEPGDQEAQPASDSHQQSQVKKRRPVLNIAILLAILIITFICFTVGVIAWAANNPRDLCKKAPQLATFFNYLPATSLVICPALADGVLLFGILYLLQRRCSVTRRLWGTDLVVVLNMMQVALGAVYFMPAGFLDETWDGHVDCAAF